MNVTGAPFRPRVIPALLLRRNGLVKTTRFDDARYLGDPINVVRIFNDKGVDELILVDIDASREGTATDHALLEEIASEAFVPVATGGGIRTLEQIEERLALGFEKVVVNTAAVEDPALIDRAAREFGSSTIAVAVDVRARRFSRREVVTRGGRQKTGLDPVAHAVDLVRRGAGEIIIQSVDRDGSMGGYDLDLIGEVAASVDVPVVALGGAGSVEDLAAAIAAGAAAVAAGSLFVFQGRHRAVLISYPSDRDLDAALTSDRRP